jgi:amino acid transporter
MSAGPLRKRITPGAPQLRRNSLGLSELVLHGITHIAPATNIIFTFPVIALKAGPDMPISFLLTTVVCCFIANTVSEFSRYMPSSGGSYSFAARGLGSRAGFMATWSYLITTSPARPLPADSSDACCRTRDAGTAGDKSLNRLIAH